MNILWGIMIPIIGTTAGAACVFFLKNNIKPVVQKTLLGFASGVMVAASVWSLLIPAIELWNGAPRLAFLPASIGLLLGVVFLQSIHFILPHLYQKKQISDKPKAKISHVLMLILAITLHNIPEGMAVGVAFAGTMADAGTISITAASALATGIAIQNFPEGAVISLPLKAEGTNRFKSFFIGMLSGIVEPVGAILTIILASYVVPILPYFLSFAAGSMLYVVSGELIPAASKDSHSDMGAIGFAIGFVIMMTLDVALG